MYDSFEKERNQFVFDQLKKNELKRSFSTMMNEQNLKNPTAPISTGREGGGYIKI